MTVLKMQRKTWDFKIMFLALLMGIACYVTLYNYVPKQKEAVISTDKENIQVLGSALSKTMEKEEARLAWGPVKRPMNFSFTLDTVFEVTEDGDNDNAFFKELRNQLAEEFPLDLNSTGARYMIVVNPVEGFTEIYADRMDLNQKLYPEQLYDFEVYK